MHMDGLRAHNIISDTENNTKAIVTVVGNFNRKRNLIYI